MRVLTFGWEFPPAQSGGLGFACQGLTQELLQSGVEVIFVLPKTQDSPYGNARFVFADQERLLRVRHADLGPIPYQQANSTIDVIVGYDESGKPIIKSRTIIEEAHRFAHQASIIAREEEFDVIHAHDWTSYLAGVAAKLATGKPLVLHVHATSFDQAASNNVDPAIFKIEREAFAMADKVVTVSGYTKNIIVKKHEVPAAKVEVVHNGCHPEDLPRQAPALAELKKQGKKVVLYVGRITIQKGVDHFVRAARRVVDNDPNVMFVICGSGDMTHQIIELVGSLGLSKNFIFTGALWFDDRDRLMQSVDLVVMPSVSEPFGLVPFEALQNGTPSIISKQSGAAEVLSHALKVDFWDTEEMANQILSSLRYPVMRQQLVKEGKWQMFNMTWRHAAEKVKRVYQSLLQYVTT
ncbi:glycosyltransferase family 4 protein [Candidatus Kaiserbacteria bacterium]|nr:glycosyltransferase family 4 protein [Candidatus Kaiserbacteria bacterium]